MDLKNISNTELTFRLEKLVRSERKITHLILLHIQEIESRRIYAQLGFDGMFSYLTKGLGYSESGAYRRIKSARLLKMVPAVAEKLEGGSLNLSQLTQVQKCLHTKPEKKSLELILTKIENKNSFETKKILAQEFNQSIQCETKLIPQKDGSVRMELTFTKEQFEVLKEAKNLLSHVVHNNSWSEVIAHLAVKFNKSILGKGKNENDNRHEEKPKIHGQFTSQMTSKVEGPLVTLSNKRVHLSIKMKRKVMKKSNHSCQFFDKTTGRRCDSKYQLQVDHIHPLAYGGSSDQENLQILCRTHNQYKGIDRCPQ